MSSKQLQGTIHGRRIDLQDDPGLADGEEVDVIVSVRPKAHKWGDGIRRSAGAWVNVPGIQEALDEVERDRRNATFRDEPA